MQPKDSLREPAIMRDAKPKKPRRAQKDKDLKKLLLPFERKQAPQEVTSVMTRYYFKLSCHPLQG
jgi:hypothetical protein